MYSKENPYDHRRPAGVDVFVGRNNIVDQLVDGLRSGHSYGLTGEAGMGKTSLLFAVKRKLTSRWFKGAIPIPIYIEIQRRHLTHESVIFETIVASFIDALVEQHGTVVSERETLLEEARKGRLQEAVRTLSNQYYKQQLRSCRLVILLDDLHRGLDCDALSEVVSVLRPLVSPNDTPINVSLVLSGELSLEQEFRKDVSSLRGLLSDTLELAPLLPNDVAALVELARDYGWSVELGSEESVFTLTGGVPFKVHYYLFAALRRYGEMSRSVLHILSRDQRVQNYLNVVLKIPVLTKHELLTHPVSQEKTRMKKIIKILFLAANPKDEVRLRLDEEMRAIDLALQQSGFRDQFEIEQHWAVRVADLQNYLLRHSPDIVHFSGHGGESGEIMLEDSSGKSHPVSSRALSRVFSILKDNICCVVLNACYAEPQAQAIALHIDCVVGMSQAIGDDAAISFSAAFYQALGYRRSIKTAFDLGCTQIDLENLDDQDVPKLLTAPNCDPAKVILINDDDSKKV